MNYFRALLAKGARGPAPGFQFQPYRKKSGCVFYSTVHSSQRRPPISRPVWTLHPDKLASEGQPVLDLSFTRRPFVQFLSNGQHMAVIVTYFNDYRRPPTFVPFPAETRGVFYFHHVLGDFHKSQLRFRLCHTLPEFSNGQDLHLPSGSPWGISLKHMAREPKYQPALALLSSEFALGPEVPGKYCQRNVATLDPLKLQSTNQDVFDISGISQPSVRVSISHHDSTNVLQYYYGRLVYPPFPPNTVGVFYYCQSQTAPTRLGEIRFRLCQDVRQFEHGTDLCLPSGEPWRISSQQIYFNKAYNGLYHLLTFEGLLDYIPDTLSKSLSSWPLRTFDDPFEVDLSMAQFHALDIIDITQRSTFQLTMNWCFRSRDIKGQPFFTGRAIVRLEPYPKLPSGDNPRGPLLALRILEILSPVRQVYEQDEILPPQPGQLLMQRRRTTKYTPWGIDPRKPDVRKAIVDCIRRSTQ